MRAREKEGGCGPHLALSPFVPVFERVMKYLCDIWHPVHKVTPRPWAEQFHAPQRTVSVSPRRLSGRQAGRQAGNVRANKLTL